MSVRSASARLSAGMSATTEQAARPLVDLAARRRRDAQRRRINVAVLRVLVAVVFLASWEILARLGWIDPFFTSQPTAVADKLWYWITQGTELGPLWEQALVTMEEAVGGFIVGSILGVVFRVVLGALFAVSLGLDIKSKIATAAVLVFFVVFFNAFQGVREVDRNLIANARILGAGDRQLTTEILIPSALSWIVASLHTSFGLALVGAVVGELFGATQGVGELIYNAEHNFDANGVFAGMLLLAVVALVAESLITGLESRLIKWRPNPVTDVTV